MIDGGGPGDPRGVLEQRDVAGLHQRGQAAVVAAGDLAAAGVVGVEERQAAVEHRRLQAVEAAVGAHQDVVVARGLAVVGEQADALDELAVVAGRGAAVAEAAEVLGRVEAPGGERAEAADPLAAPERPLRLRRVLEQPQAVLPAQGEDGVDVEGAAVEVDAEDAHGTTGDPRRRVGRVEVERPRVDVGEDRPAAEEDDRLGGGEEGEGGDDHLVPWAQAEGAQGEHQGVGAVGEAGTGGDPQVGGEGRLEFPHLGAEDEGALGKDALPAFVEPGGDPLPGAAQVEDGDVDVHD